MSADEQMRDDALAGAAAMFADGDEAAEHRDEGWDDEADGVSRRRARARAPPAQNSHAASANRPPHGALTLQTALPHRL